MTRSTKGTADAAGRNVKQKSGLNQAILRTDFFALRQALEWQQCKNGGYVVAVRPSYTSREVLVPFGANSENPPESCLQRLAQ